MPYRPKRKYTIKQNRQLLNELLNTGNFREIRNEKRAIYLKHPQYLVFPTNAETGYAVLKNGDVKLFAGWKTKTDIPSVAGQYIGVHIHPDLPKMRPYFSSKDILSTLSNEQPPIASIVIDTHGRYTAFFINPEFMKLSSDVRAIYFLNIKNGILFRVGQTIYGRRANHRKSVLNYAPYTLSELQKLGVVTIKTGKFNVTHKQDKIAINTKQFTDFFKLASQQKFKYTPISLYPASDKDKFTLLITREGKIIKDSKAGNIYTPDIRFWYIPYSFNKLHVIRTDSGYTIKTPGENIEISVKDNGFLNRHISIKGKILSGPPGNVDLFYRFYKK